MKNLFPNADEGTRNFLNKFERFTIESTKKDSVIFTNGLRVTYDINVGLIPMLYPEINSDNLMPIQVILRVTMNKTYVESWGCMSHDDNNLALVWFQHKDVIGSKMVRDRREKIELDYKKLMS